MDPVRPCAGRVAPVRIDSPVLSPCWVALCKYTRRKLNEQRRRCSCNMKFKTLKGISITSQSGRSSRSRSSYRSVSRRTKKGHAMRGLSKYERFLCHDRRRQKIEGCGVQKWRTAMIPTETLQGCDRLHGNGSGTCVSLPSTNSHAHQLKCPVAIDDLSSAVASFI